MSQRFRAWHTITTYLSRGFDDTLGDFGLAADANSVVRADLFDQLVFGHGLGRVVNVEALCLEGPDGLLADVLEQQQAQVLVFRGVEGARLADGKAYGHGVLSAGAEVVEGGRGDGGDGDGSLVCSPGNWDGSTHRFKRARWQRQSRADKYCTG